MTGFDIGTFWTLAAAVINPLWGLILWLVGLFGGAS